MTRRKWLVRGLVLACVGGAAVAGLLYQRWTNPQAVRRQVLDKLAAQFPGAAVSLESARLRLLGGVSLNELRLARRDDPDKADFLYVPQALVYHDKERLLDGKLRIRKLELNRPRLRVVRSAQGRWNLEGILGPSEPGEPLPTVVIKQGTLIVEDHTAGPDSPSLEFKDINLTLVEDAPPTVAFAGSGTSDVAGPVHITGTWHKASGQAALAVEATAIPVGPALVQRLALVLPDFAAHARQLEGVGRLRAAFSFRPGGEPAWGHEVHFRLAKGALRHAQLPVPLEGLDLSVNCVNGLVSLESCRASAGPAQLQVSFKDLDLARAGESGDLGQLRRLDVKVEHLPLTADLFDRLPPCWANLCRDLSLDGAVTVVFSSQRDTDGRWQRRCVVQPEGASVCARQFPYRLEDLSGTLQFECDGGSDQKLTVGLVGHAAGRPVFIKGDVIGNYADYDLALEVGGDDIPLDEKLLKALPGKTQDLARSLRPTGKANFRSSLRRDPFTRRLALQHWVHFHDAAVCYAKFPYALEGVSGTLQIWPDRWEFRDFRGSHRGGEVRVQGRTYPGDDADRLVMQVAGTGIWLDDRLKAALVQKELKDAWELLDPRGGRVDFDARLNLAVNHKDEEAREEAPAADALPDLELTVRPRGCTVCPRFFPCELSQVEGQVRYARRWVLVDGLRARHGDSFLSLNDGYVYLRPEGGYYARLEDVRGSPVVPGPELTHALPAAVARACEALELKDPVSLQTRLIVSATKDSARWPEVYWDGTLAVRDAALKAGVPFEHVTGQVACRGRYNGEQLEGVVGSLHLGQAVLFRQPLRDVQCPLLVTKDAPETLRLNDLWMRYCGGEVYGPLRVEFGPTVRYELKLTASQVRLQEFARQNPGLNAQMRGLASASLYLTGQGADVSNLKGSGTLDVPEGKMSNLPLLLDLLKVLGLRLPDRTAFEEAHAAFDVQGPRLQFSRLNLFGNAISLRGKGDMNLDGTGLNLDFHADWARITQVLPPGIRKIPSALSDQLLKIQMRGRVGDVRLTKEPVPMLVDPIKRVWTEIRAPEPPAQPRP